MRNYPDIGIQVAEILLPRPEIDLEKWAVIACDQFTSEPGYWQQVTGQVGGAPSTLNLILPEVYLGADEPARIQKTRQCMRDYLDLGLLTPHEGLVLVERRVDGKTRWGLMLALDLEAYDFHAGSQTLIRATEGTILDRLPPRIRIREGAPLELPHILVLIDDPARSVIEPLAAQASSLPRLYETDLMLGSGHVSGYAVKDPGLEARVVAALRKLANPTAFRSRYGVSADKGVLLFAMGDGNHSLATAKAIWEKLKPQVSPDHPARYALVEIENIHDPGLEFEPIHRAVFGVKEDLASALRRAFGDRVSLSPTSSFSGMVERVKAHPGPGQAIGVVSPQASSVLIIDHPASYLPVGTLQVFLDAWVKAGGAERIDYVHGEDVIQKLGAVTGNLGFYLPAMRKGDLFKTVVLDGALPRKTFSMGEAREKRFYLEARRIG